MRMSISKKLIGGFLGLAFLVLLAGLVGIIELKKVSSAANTVANEKAPIRYGVMNATVAVNKIEKNTIGYASSTNNLDKINTQINDGFDEFNMWITMLQFGTDSEEFRNSSAQATYNAKDLNIHIPQSSADMLPIVNTLVKESKLLKKKTEELVDAHRKQVSYGVVVDSQLLALPHFLNLAQRTHLDWTKQIKDAVNIETKFTGNTEPGKGLICTWLNSYTVPDQKLMAIMAKFKKRYRKLLKMAQKINTLSSYKSKQRALNRGIGTTAKIESYFSKLHRLSKKIYSRLQATNHQKQSELTATVTDINKQLKRLIDIAESEMTVALHKADSAEKNGRTVLIVLTLVAVILASLLGTLISRFMSSKISAIAESTKNIAEGNLQKTLTITSNDELGTLAGDTNAMIRNLREMIGQILTFSGKLTGSADDLTSVSHSLDNNAEGLAAKSSEASEATATMNRSMLDISSLANDSMQRVQNVALATGEMSSTITEIAQNAEQARSVTNKAVKTVENTTVKMNELSEAATEIGKVADVIVNIAEQTNLLSLNATIEAARAGEAGKGFAVVANEVKELAGQTNKATEDIREKIVAIQQSSNMTISEITEITQIINDINAIVVSIAGAVEEQAATTKQITEDINSVSGGIEGVTENVDSAAGISETVAADIDQIQATSKNIGEESNHIQNHATELAQLAEELNNLVGQFKV